MTKVYDYLAAGDLIFCRDNSVVSRALRMAQRYVDGQVAPYSHAAMCIHPGLLIHSVPGGGVQLLRIEEDHPEAIDLVGGNGTDIAVLRLEKWPIQALALLQAMLFWTGQTYNFSFLKPVEGVCGKAYCSQLIVQILTRAGVGLPDELQKGPVTPSKLFREISRLPMMDVTGRYRHYGRLLKECPQERYLLANDIPREMIMRGARHNLDQARMRLALTAGTAKQSAAAAAGITDMAIAVRRLRGCTRPVRTISSELCSYLTGAALLFEISKYNTHTEAAHHLDTVGAPAVIISGVFLYRAQLETIALDIHLLIREFAALCDFLFELRSPESIPEAELAAFFGYCQNRLYQTSPIEFSEAEAQLRRFPDDLEALAAREPIFAPMATQILQIAAGIEALKNMHAALSGELSACRRYWEGEDHDRSRQNGR
jgi:hypothetical protein